MTQTTFILLLLAEALSDKTLVIHSAEDFAKAKSMEYNHLILAENITVPTTWEFFGFTGIFDGGGFAISMLSISELFTSLFASSIFNLTLIESTGYSYTGMLASIIDETTIESCTFISAHIESPRESSPYVSGLGGVFINSTIINCTGLFQIVASEPTLTSVGAVFLHASHSVLINCSFVSKFFIASSSTAVVGGVIGTGYNVTVINCSVTAIVSSTHRTSYTFGGLIGNVTSYASSVTGSKLNVSLDRANATQMNIGGVAGVVETAINVTATLSIVSGVATIFDFGKLGGIIGIGSEGSTVGILQSEGLIDLAVISDGRGLNADVSGGVGQSGGSIAVDSTGVNGSIHISGVGAMCNIGGLVGRGTVASIVRSVSKLALYCSMPFVTQLTVGGIAGYLGSGNISESGYIGQMIVAAGSSVIGGIVGWAAAPLMRCYSLAWLIVSGGASAHTRVVTTTGGLAGQLHGSQIRDCYSVTKIKVNGLAISTGGLAGELMGCAVFRSFSIYHLVTFWTGAASHGGAFGACSGVAELRDVFTIVFISIQSSTRPLNVSGVGGTSKDGCIFHNCVVYGSITIPQASKLNAGLLIAGGAPVTGSDCFAIVSVSGDGGRRVPFVPGPSSAGMTHCACADLGGSAGCIDPKNLMLDSPLFDDWPEMRESFAASRLFMNQFLYLVNLPVILEFALVDLVLSNASGSNWTSRDWIADELLYPVADYSFLCQRALGCRGVAHTPTDITCDDGWIDGSSKTCSLRACTSDTECNGDTCQSSRCVCSAGRTGPQCNDPVCEPEAVLVASVCMCIGETNRVGDKCRCPGGKLFVDSHCADIATHNAGAIAAGIVVTVVVVAATLTAGLTVAHKKGMLFRKRAVELGIPTMRLGEI